MIQIQKIKIISEKGKSEIISRLKDLSDTEKNISRKGEKELCGSFVDNGFELSRLKRMQSEKILPEIIVKGEFTEEKGSTKADLRFGISYRWFLGMILFYAALVFYLYMDNRLEQFTLDLIIVLLIIASLVVYELLKIRKYLKKIIIGNE